ncbi:hypothetical protein [Blastomonas sp.]|uniref:phosphoribosyltransferase-like protein n=1 Tax=Blastomonas sp. TaxID=1909299 RepID=UPI00391A450F
MSALFNIVNPWLFDADSDDLIALRDHLLWLQSELFNEYEPNRYEAFDDRLVEWLNNIDSTEDQKTLFRLLRHLFFIGKQQFDSLCRAAFGGQATRWVIDHAKIDIQAPNLSSLVNQAMYRTWFCPITDSMRINSFLKLNQLSGHDNRPDWRSLSLFGDPLAIRSYLINQKIERLVLLEDFVGTGNQMAKAVHWAATCLPNTPILVLPLVCCPEGLNTGKALASDCPNVTFSPALILHGELFLGATPQANEPNIFPKVRELISRLGTRMGIWAQHPYGYEATGALVALYSNCPDNTLPIIHHHGPQWSPLFSRIRRS